MQGWRQGPDGGLWVPNRLVRVASPSLGLAGEFLISGVELSLSASGLTATLDLALPDAYKAAPLVRTASGGGKGSRKGSGAWAEIADGAKEAP